MDSGNVSPLMRHRLLRDPATRPSPRPVERNAKAWKKAVKEIGRRMRSIEEEAGEQATDYSIEPSKSTSKQRETLRCHGRPRS